MRGQLSTKDGYMPVCGVVWRTVSQTEEILGACLQRYLGDRLANRGISGGMSARLVGRQPRGQISKSRVLCLRDCLGDSLADTTKQQKQNTKKKNVSPLDK